ncbi:MAG: tetratricopeptide repeat-containing glycosyltransferase family protein [Rhodospirillales bacterium]
MEPIPPPSTATAGLVPVPIGELFTLAADCERSGKLQQADSLLNHMLTTMPNQPDSLHLAGIVSFRLGRIEQALDLMQKAIRFGVDTPLYLRNICEVYRTLGRLDEALETASRAVELSPSDPLCLHNLAIIHYERLEIDESIACAERALLMNDQLPGAHFELAEALLLQGKWDRGWEEYEWRFRIASAAPLMPPTGKPQWQGESFPDDTLLLVADQGFGDVIQFCRYIPWVAERCPNIALACAAEVAPLLAQIHPSLHLFQKWEDAPPYRAFAALSGLPRLHGTRIDNTPAPIPYLHAIPTKVAAWKDRLDRLIPRGFKRIGIVWAGRPTHNNDRRRSATLATFAPLFNLSKIALVSLQKGPSSDQTGKYFGRAPLINLGAEIVDYDDTMAIVENLDIVVTVDTSVGHLAAALGRPVWILLATAPDWRWLLERSDTPWYPTVRLFRQTVARQWTDVMQQVADALRERFAPPPVIEAEPVGAKQPRRVAAAP